MAFVTYGTRIKDYVEYRDTLPRPGRVCQGVLIMTSSNWNIVRVTGPLWGKSTGHRGIPITKPATRSFDVFFDAPEQTVEQTTKPLVIWDSIALSMTSL